MDLNAYARGEMADHQLDAFISKRDEKRRASEGERPAEEIWAESERRYAARRREENRQAWAAFHEGQVARHRAVLESLIAHHEQAVARLMETEETEPKGQA